MDTLKQAIIWGDFDPPLTEHPRKNNQRFIKGTGLPQYDMVTFSHMWLFKFKWIKSRTSVSKLY